MERAESNVLEHIRNKLAGQSRILGEGERSRKRKVGGEFGLSLGLHGGLRLGKKGGRSGSSNRSGLLRRDNKRSLERRSDLLGLREEAETTFVLQSLGELSHGAGIARGGGADNLADLGGAFVLGKGLVFLHAQSESGLERHILRRFGGRGRDRDGDSLLGLGGGFLLEMLKTIFDGRGQGLVVVLQETQ